MNVYAKATGRSKRDAIAALPFTKKTSAPEHVIQMTKRHAQDTVVKDTSQGVDTKRLG